MAANDVYLQCDYSPCPCGIHNPRVWTGLSDFLMMIEFNKNVRILLLRYAFRKLWPPSHWQSLHCCKLAHVDDTPCHVVGCAAGNLRDQLKVASGP